MNWEGIHDRSLDSTWLELFPVWIAFVEYVWTICRVWGCRGMGMARTADVKDDAAELQVRVLAFFSSCYFVFWEMWQYPWDQTAGYETRDWCGVRIQTRTGFQASWALLDRMWMSILNLWIWMVLHVLEGKSDECSLRLAVWRSIVWYVTFTQSDLVHRRSVDL